MKAFTRGYLAAPMEIIDLRSDTVTKPDAAMRAAMAQAVVGDDVFGEDPTVNQLEERMASLFGHQAGLFCPSGTQTNQIGIHVHVRPGDELICEEGAHVYRYEGGGTMATSGCSVRFVAADLGRFTAQAVEAAVNPADAPGLARTRLVVVENSNNRGGGSIWDLEEVLRIRAVCDRHGLALHLDGARIFNAMVEDGRSPQEWGAPFHTVSVCLSKGLGAPVGSVLLGSAELIRQARRVRKRLGGGMRQAGILAAGCLHALDQHLPGLKEDHAKARLLAEAIAGLPWVASVLPVRTNIVVFQLAPGLVAADRVRQMRSAGILAAEFGPGTLRLVTHRDVDRAMLHRCIERLRTIVP
jgi:threonine aldolase